MPIIVKNLSKSFDGKAVLSGLSFELPDRGVVAVEGRSGAGKTTLLNILLGLVPPDAGMIDGLADRRATAVFQENRLLEHWSAMRNIRLVCPRSVTDADIREHLREVGLAGEEKTPVRALSGGMKRRGGGKGPGGSGARVESFSATEPSRNFRIVTRRPLSASGAEYFARISPVAPS